MMRLRPSLQAMLLLACGMAFLLMAINDGNNLLYLLALLPLSLLLAGSWHGWRILRHASLSIHAPPPGFARSPRLWRLELRSTLPHGALTVSNRYWQCHFDGAGRQDVSDTPAARRAAPWPTLHLRASDPLGLLVWQRTVHLDGEEQVWPAAEGGLPLPPAAPGAQQLQAQDETPLEWRPWRSGDSPRRVLWRAYARHGRLLVPRQQQELHHDHLLTQHALRSLPLEAQLSQLAAWIVAAPHHQLLLDDDAPASHDPLISLARLARYPACETTS